MYIRNLYNNGSDLSADLCIPFSGSNKTILKRILFINIKIKQNEHHGHWALWQSRTTHYAAG